MEWGLQLVTVVAATVAVAATTHFPLPSPLILFPQGVLLVLGQNDTSWSGMKKFLGAKAVKDNLLSFDARSITPAIRDAVQKLLTQKAASFEHATIYRVSVAAAPLAAWVKATVRFSVVLEKVAPLEQELAGLTSAMEGSEKRLEACRAEVTALDEEVGDLKKDFAMKTGEAETHRAG